MHKNQNSALQVLSYSPLSFHTFLEYKSLTIQTTDLKLHRWIDLIVEKTLRFIIFELLPFVNFSLSNIIQATDLKLHRWIDLKVEKSSAVHKKH